MALPRDYNCKQKRIFKRKICDYVQILRYSLNCNNAYLVCNSFSLGEMDKGNSIIILNIKNMKSKFKKYIPHAIAVVLFIGLSIAFMAPIVFENEYNSRKNLPKH